MKALLFDMDGVLVDVSQSYRLAIKKTAEFFAKQAVTDEDIQKVKNKGGFNNDWDAAEEIIRVKGKTADKKWLIKKFQEFYQGNNFNGLIKNEKWLLKKPILKELKNNFKLGIVTGRPRDEAEFALKSASTKEYFDVLVAMDDIEGEKPNPLPLKIALEQLNCKEGFYFGDCVDDMQMAVNANLAGIGVIPPGVNGNLRKLLTDNGAKAVLDDINKIREVLK